MAASTIGDLGNLNRRSGIEIQPGTLFDRRPLVLVPVLLSPTTSARSEGITLASTSSLAFDIPYNTNDILAVRYRQAQTGQYADLRSGAYKPD